MYRADLDPDGGSYYYPRKIDGEADLRGVTDADGLFELGARPFAEGFYAPVHPFKRPLCGVLVIEVLMGDASEVQFLDVTDFNLARWRGATERAVFPLRTDLPR